MTKYFIYFIFATMFHLIILSRKMYILSSLSDKIIDNEVDKLYGK